MKRRILLADDSVTIQKVIELTFMDEDFEVRAVSNGDEAVALLPEVKPDFVIADVHMPGANGYEVCRRSKQLQAGVPVLLLVGTFEPFDENEARAAGADSFLKKPFDSQELLQRVQELLAPIAAPAPVAAAAPPSPPSPPEPPSPAITERASLPTLEFPPAAQPAAPAFSPEPFDYEPSFALEPDPAYHVEEEPVFELEESPAPLDVHGEVFGAPAELALDEPHDHYLAEEPAAAAPAAPAAHAAGFDAPAAPVEPQPTAPEPAPAAIPAAAAAEAGNGGGQLSDGDVDRIARRLVELLSDKTVRDVAWEVIPDMAEVIIRDRLRELESQVE